MSTALNAFDVCKTLSNAGHKAFFVGGCVRDLCLGVTPKDFDVATSATLQQVLDLFPGESKVVGASFGVALVRGTEVAQFRSESGTIDGRHPENVVFHVDPELDAARRDFTINAMMFDPFTGKILDFFDGQDDLVDKILRTVGVPEFRFYEDYLRMLRAVRFAHKYNLTLEEGTARGIRIFADKITEISQERIRMELEKLFSLPNSEGALRLVDETGLLEHVLPEVEALKYCMQSPDHHPEGFVFTHVCNMLREFEAKFPYNPDTHLTMVLAILFHDIAKPHTQNILESGKITFYGHAERGAVMTRDIMNRLKFPNDVTNLVCNMVLVHMKFFDVKKMKVSTLKRFMRTPEFELYHMLHYADCMGSAGNKETYDFVSEKLEEFSKEELTPKYLLTGNDLREMGFKPGPAFGKMLHEVETLQLEGTLKTVADAKQFALDNFERMM